MVSVDCAPGEESCIIRKRKMKMEVVGATRNVTFIQTSSPLVNSRTPGSLCYESFPHSHLITGKQEGTDDEHLQNNSLPTPWSRSVGCLKTVTLVKWPIRSIISAYKTLLSTVTKLSELGIMG